jgi:hypothetical protein
MTEICAHFCRAKGNRKTSCHGRDSKHTLKGVSVYLSQQLAKDVFQVDSVNDEKYCASQAHDFSLSGTAVFEQRSSVHDDQVPVASSKREDVEWLPFSSAERKNLAESSSEIVRQSSSRNLSATARKKTDFDYDAPDKDVDACSYEDQDGTSGDKDSSCTNMKVSSSCSHQIVAVRSHDKLHTGPCYAEGVPESDGSWEDSPLLLSVDFSSGTASESANCQSACSIVSSKETELKMLGRDIRENICTKTSDVPSCTKQSTLYATKSDGKNETLSAVTRLAFSPVSIETKHNASSVSAEISDQSDNYALDEGNRVDNDSDLYPRKEIDADTLGFRDETCSILKHTPASEVQNNLATTRANQVNVLSSSSKDKIIGHIACNKHFKRRDVPRTSTTKLNDFEKTVPADRGDNFVSNEAFEWAETGEFVEADERLSPSEFNERTLACREQTANAIGLASESENIVGSLTDITAAGMFDGFSDRICSSREVPHSRLCSSASSMARKSRVETSGYSLRTRSQKIRTDGTLWDGYSVSAMRNSADHCSVEDNVSENSAVRFESVSDKRNSCHISSAPNTVTVQLAEKQIPPFAATHQQRRERCTSNIETEPCGTSLSSLTGVCRVKQVETSKCSFVTRQIMRSDETSRNHSRLETGLHVPVMLSTFSTEPREVTVEKDAQLSGHVSSQNTEVESLVRRKSKVSEPLQTVIHESLGNRTRPVLKRFDLGEFLGESSPKEDLQDISRKNDVSFSDKLFNRTNDCVILDVGTVAAEVGPMTSGSSLQLQTRRSHMQLRGSDSNSTDVPHGLSNKASKPLYNIWSDRLKSAPEAVGKKNAEALINLETLELRGGTIGSCLRKLPETSTTQRTLSLLCLNSASSFREKKESAVKSASLEQQTEDLKDCKNGHSEPFPVGVRESLATCRPSQSCEYGSYDSVRLFKHRLLCSTSGWENVTTLSGSHIASNSSPTQPVIAEETAVFKGECDLSRCAPFSLGYIPRDENRAYAKSSRPRKTVAAAYLDHRLELAPTKLTDDRRKDIISAMEANATRRYDHEKRVQSSGSTTVESDSQQRMLPESTEIENWYPRAYVVSETARTQLPLDSPSLTRNVKSSEPADPVVCARLSSEISREVAEVICLRNELKTTPASRYSLSQSFPRMSYKTGEPAFKDASGTSDIAVVQAPTRTVSDQDHIHSSINDCRQSFVKSKPEICEPVEVIRGVTGMETTEFAHTNCEVDCSSFLNRISHSDVSEMSKVNEPNKVISSETSAGRRGRHTWLFEQTENYSSPSKKMLEQGRLGNGSSEESIVGFVKSSRAEVMIFHFEEAGE